ncbi:MAG: hypothetical protein H6739_21195 [Alphaproteobacteria bacterium]|nr:hypothetical protein [Alphaproteobacteria bacterium]
MHEQGLKLEALWKQDQARDALLAEGEGLRVRVERTAAQLEEARAKAAAAREALDALQAEEARRSKRMATYEKRRDQAIRLIEEGRAPDFRVAQSQAEQCAAIVDEEETALLDLMEQIDAAQGSLEALTNGQQLLELRHREATEAREARAPGLADALAGATAERDAAREGIFRENLSRYDILRRKGVTPFADVRGDACTGCQVGINAIARSEHRRGVALVHCRHCGRFLGEIL